MPFIWKKKEKKKRTEWEMFIRCINKPVTMDIFIQLVVIFQGRAQLYYRSPTEHWPEYQWQYRQLKKITSTAGYNLTVSIEKSDPFSVYIRVNFLHCILHGSFPCIYSSCYCKLRQSFLYTYSITRNERPPLCKTSFSATFHVST